MIQINGKVYQGNSISIKNGNIIIDGNKVETDEKQISIIVNGNIESIDADSCERIEVTGNIGKISTVSGDVRISGDVNGSVKTISGDVRCGNVSGSVDTVSGDIEHR